MKYDNTIGFEGQINTTLGNVNNSLPGSFGPYPNYNSNPIHNGINPPWWLYIIMMAPKLLT